MRLHLRTAVIVLLTLGLLALFLRNADFGQVWAAILRSRWDLIVAALVATAATYVLRALRWQYLLAPIGATRFSSAFKATVIGFAASALLPARAGEVLRPYLVARWEGMSATASMATILLERLLDLLTVVVLLAAFLLLFDPVRAAVDPEVFATVRLGGLVAAVTSIVALVVVFVLAGHPETLGRLTLKAERLLPARGAAALSRAVEKFVRGFAVMRQPRRLIGALLVSFPLWASIAAGIWLTSAAFDIVFPYTGSFLLVALLVVGVSVPTPGAVGGFHEAYRIGATAFYGAPNDHAVAAAIVLHALSFMPVAVVGLVFMAQAGLDFAGMRRLATQPDLTGEAASVAVPEATAPSRPRAVESEPRVVARLAPSSANDEGRAG